MEKMLKVLTQALPLTRTPMPNRRSKVATTLTNQRAHGMAAQIKGMAAQIIALSKHGILEKIGQEICA
jgi:hypothetical protein